MPAVSASAIPQDQYRSGPIQNRSDRRWRVHAFIGHSLRRRLSDGSKDNGAAWASIPAAASEPSRLFHRCSMTVRIVRKYFGAFVSRLLMCAIAKWLVLRQSASANPDRQFRPFGNLVRPHLFMPYHSRHGFPRSVVGARRLLPCARSSAIKDQPRHSSQIPRHHAFSGHGRYAVCG